MDIEAIRKRVEKASKGPWEVASPEHPGPDQENDRLIFAIDLNTGKRCHVAETYQYMNHENKSGPSIENADFIAHAREDIPVLLALLSERDKELVIKEKMYSAMRDARDKYFVSLTLAEDVVYAWAVVAVLAGISVEDFECICDPPSEADMAVINLRLALAAFGGKGGSDE